MLRQLRWAALTVGVFFTLTAFTSLYAAAPGDDIYREGTAAGKMSHKFGRGVVNIFTGWIEIPKNMAKRWKETDPFTGCVVGGCEGMGWGICRTFTGFYDVSTFLFAVPKDYAPLMEPEFVLPTIWGNPIPEMEPVSGLTPLAP